MRSGPLRPSDRLSGQLSNPLPALGLGLLLAPWLAVLLAGAGPVSARPASGGAEMQGSQVVSWGQVKVAAGPELAFEVLTDYDRMTDFLPGMLASEVVARKGNSVIVEQSSEQGVLFFRQRLDARLAIDESPPRKLTIRALAGSFKELTGTYEVIPRKDHTLIEYRARFVPDFSLPPMIGTYAVRQSLERHLDALADEMDRRLTGGPADPAGEDQAGSDPDRKEHGTR